MPEYAYGFIIKSTICILIWSIAWPHHLERRILRQFTCSSLGGHILNVIHRSSSQHVSVENCNGSYMVHMVNTWLYMVIYYNYIYIWLIYVNMKIRKIPSDFFGNSQIPNGFFNQHSEVTNSPRVTEICGIQRDPRGPVWNSPIALLNHWMNHIVTESLLYISISTTFWLTLTIYFFQKTLHPA